jgi:thioredoxin reductase
MDYPTRYGVIIIGGGHAGTEAAFAYIMKPMLDEGGGHECNQVPIALAHPGAQNCHYGVQS